MNNSNEFRDQNGFRHFKANPNKIGKDTDITKTIEVKLCKLHNSERCESCFLEFNLMRCGRCVEHVTLCKECQLRNGNHLFYIKAYQERTITVYGTHITEQDIQGNSWICAYEEKFRLD